MAIWQFPFYIIPNSLVEDKIQRIGTSENILDNDEVLSWKDIELSVNLDLLALSLPRESSWSEDMIQLGKTSETCIEIMLEGTKIDSIFIRIDLRSITKILFTAIMDFINQAECKILLLDGRIIEPDFDSFLNLIKESSHFAFVKAPEEFLARLHNR